MDRSVSTASQAGASNGIATLSGSVRPEDDPRVAAALEDYLQQLRTGGPPDRDAFLRRHADVADVLDPCLDGLELVHVAAPDLPLREAAAEMPEVTLPASSLLGDYRILREVGRGGMGVVYEAQQVSLGRRVALKVLPLAAALDPRQLQRFRIEAQAAALLHHPHIVPIYAVGHDRGLHYYAMQFIDGPTLAEVVRDLAAIGKKEVAPELHSIPAASGLSGAGRDFARAVARLGGQAAEALEHAHGLGVLHRDVKPSNLMLDAHGDLWMTDFGLARVGAAAEADLTRTGDLLGTLRYMSPEQAAGGRVVDQRADIYALGATLYELLTLRPAFDGHDRAALLRAIAQDEPPAPRRLDPSLPRDVETIVLKAMAKEPASRYATAQEMADDLGRFLADQSIRARRPGPLELSARWARRHRTVVVTALTVLLVTLTAAAGLLWREQRHTRQALDELRSNQAREHATWDSALRAADSFIYPLMGLASAKGALQGREGLPTYEGAAQLYESLARSFEHDPTLRPFAARAYRRVGFFRVIMETMYRTPQKPSGDDAYRKAIELSESICGEPEGVSHRAALISLLDEYLNWLVIRNRTGEAASIARRMVERAEAWGDEVPPTSDERARLAQAINDLSWRILTRPDFPMRDPRRAVALAEKAVAILPETPGLGAFWNTLGYAYYRVGDDAGAAEALEKAAEFNRVICIKDAPSGRPEDWLILAMVRHRQGDAAEARRLFERAHAWVEGARDWLAEHPEQSLADFYLLDAEAAGVLGLPPLPPGPAGANRPAAAP